MEIHSFADSLKTLLDRIRRDAFFIGLLSLIWFVLRTGTKPSRAVYPCQRAAAANSYEWLTSSVLPFLSLVPRRLSASLDRKTVIVILMAAVIVASAALWSLREWDRTPPSEGAGLTITGWLASSQPASDIFVVNGTSGNDGGLVELINLMGDKGLLFYRSQEEGKNRGPTGLIANDDVIIIKVNSQWDERGGTNTDLLKALIQAMVDHPDGFTGEIVVADNGQDQYGSAQGGGGSLDYSQNNAEDRSQSVQKVVDLFAGSYDVSTYLWDTITTERVNEYSDGDMQDGYVVNATANLRTGIMVSYPKFKTEYGTYISFKLGVWDPQTQTYDSARLKVINVPVVKSHSGYGVTACVKHYMGVVSDKLTRELGARSHNTVGRGGMGTEMVETRVPVLNVIDAIWVNARPSEGPGTPYERAKRVNVIAASIDPVALDYWAAKYILLQAAQIEGYGGVSSMDPNNEDSGSFGHWLRLSMEEIRRAGYQSTVEEASMNVHVHHFQTA